MSTIDEALWSLIEDYGEATRDIATGFDASDRRIAWRRQENIGQQIRARITIADSALDKEMRDAANLLQLALNNLTEGRSKVRNCVAVAHVEADAYRAKYHLSRLRGPLASLHLAVKNHDSAGQGIAVGQIIAVIEGWWPDEPKEG